MFTNAASVGNKWSELQVRAHGADVVAITETWLRSEQRSIDRGFAGYTGSRADREDGRTGGGVMLLVANHYEHYAGTRIVTPNVQAIEILLNTGQGEMGIACCYRSPSADERENEALIGFLQHMADTNPRVLIVGDFNAPEVSWDSETAPRGTFGQQLVALLHAKTLVQHVQQETRWREGHTPSTLDLVITRGMNEVRQLRVEEPVGKSDHGLLRFKVNTSKQPAPDKYR